jgi:hypothetical protein
MELFAKVGFVGGPTPLEDQEIGRERGFLVENAYNFCF